MVCAAGDGWAMEGPTLLDRIGVEFDTTVFVTFIRRDQGNPGS
jgi:hypothetical protein